MHKQMMTRALELAKKGIGHVNPNPLVGALIVKNNHIIAEGFHAVYGSHHAEINALHVATTSVQGATMYVTLEPCSHVGKTPPCAKAIIESGIKEVYVASKDPNPLVAGRGIAMLKDAGIIVHVGLMDQENKQLNKVFFTYIQKNVPYVVLKTAMSLDGKIATNSGDSKWISNEKSRAYVHELRHQYPAIMVGVNTVIQDDPMLTTRLTSIQGRNPIRIVIDSKGIIPIDSKIVKTAHSIPTILATTELCSKDVQAKLKEHFVDVLVTSRLNDHVDLQELMRRLAIKGIDGILLEGGGTLNAEALKAGIVDEIIAFIAPKIISGKDALTPVSGTGIESMQDALELKLIDYKRFDDDVMVQYEVKKER